MLLFVYERTRKINLADVGAEAKVEAIPTERAVVV